MASVSKKYYDSHPEAKKVKNEYQSKYNKKKRAKLLIASAQRLRRKLGLKVGDKRDAAHYKGSKTEGRPQARSKNRNRYA